jgi:RsiW-degrading membrane proteinase PrsW (M82 family)
MPDVKLSTCSSRPAADLPFRDIVWVEAALILHYVWSTFFVDFSLLFFKHIVIIEVAGNIRIVFGA